VADAEQLLATERGRARQAKREWRDLGNADANALFLREPQLAAAEATLASARADLEQAELDLAKTAISAPFAGRIRETYVNLGQYVGPGTRVARVFDSEVVEVRLPLTDAQVALLDLSLGYRAAPGQGPEVTLKGTVAGQVREWQGRITRTDASLDTRTRMYHAVAEVRQADNSEAPLVVGLFVRARISGKAIEGVIQLPRTALYKNDTLVAIGADHRVSFVQAQVLASNENNVWILADLPVGVHVATGRQGYLRPGVEVNPVLAAPELEVAQ
jgi:RND family efflux transporter MFP subunit